MIIKIADAGGTTFRDRVIQASLVEGVLLVVHESGSEAQSFHVKSGSVTLYSDGGTELLKTELEPTGEST